MKAMKALLMFAVVLGVIVAGAISLWLGRGVKLAVERYGPALIGAPVTVGAVVLTPWSGRGAIKDLVIGNPPGFKGARALSVGSVEVRLRLSSLAGDTIVVDSVVVREPEVIYELGSGGSNLARLQRNAEAANPRDGAAPAKGGPSKSLLIKDLVVTGGKVGLSASALGGKDATIALPGIHLTDLGGKGRSPAQAVSQVLAALSASAAKAAASLPASSLIGKIGGLLKGLR